MRGPVYGLPEERRARRADSYWQIGWLRRGVLQGLLGGWRGLKRKRIFQSQLGSSARDVVLPLTVAPADRDADGDNGTRRISIVIGHSCGHGMLPPPHKLPYGSTMSTKRGAHEPQAVLQEGSCWIETGFWLDVRTGGTVIEGLPVQAGPAVFQFTEAAPPQAVRRIQGVTLAFGTRTREGLSRAHCAPATVPTGNQPLWKTLADSNDVSMYGALSLWRIHHAGGSARGPDGLAAASAACCTAV